MDLATLIKKRRLELGMSQEELARLVGVKRQTVAEWESGATGPKRSRAVDVARALQIKPEQLDPRAGLGLAYAPHLPHYDQIALISLDDFRLGDWPQVIHKAGEFVQVEHAIGDAFAVIVSDESMAPTMRRGDVVIVKRDAHPLPEDLVVVAFQEATAAIRRYRPRGRGSAGVETFDLVPESPDYATLTITGPEQGLIIGVAIEHRRKLR